MIKFELKEKKLEETQKKCENGQNHTSDTLL